MEVEDSWAGQEHTMYKYMRSLAPKWKQSRIGEAKRSNQGLNGIFGQHVIFHHDTWACKTSGKPNTIWSVRKQKTGDFWESIIKFARKALSEYHGQLQRTKSE